jgi:glycosyltransferase-like protein
MTTRRLRIGIFTYSTRPRGGVAHALDLASALSALGHDVVVTAPNESGSGFFRRPSCATRVFPAAATSGGTVGFVRQRIDEYVAFCERDDERFDVYHAQDGISANALATLVERGRIPGFLRTVHHLDAFEEQELRAWQDRSVTSADRCFVVSRIWQARLLAAYDLRSTVVSNGVDTTRFAPLREERRLALRRALGFADGPLFVSIGGIEARKNTLGVLDGFMRVRERIPQARLAIAGGASVFDHSPYRRAFIERAGAAGLRLGAEIVELGVVPDAVVVELLQAADALVFPSLNEGFGLVALEALACGTPVVASAVPPFTEYLGPDDALLVDPADSAAIGGAMLRVLEPAVQTRCRRHGPAFAATYSWSRSALAHLAAYHHDAEHPAKEIDRAGDAVRRALAG